MTSIQSFNDLSLAPEILKAIAATGYTQPTPIQAQAIPIVMRGKDLLGIAQTGTGKTAAFSLPLIHRLIAQPNRRQPKSTRALILTPTRELAIQIQKNIETYARFVDLKHTAVFGGVSQVHQVKALANGVDILVATPGRLLDLIEQKKLRLDRVEVFILDEADRMLDMGFAPDIKRIIPMLPSVRHNLFFSATMPKEIQTLAQSILVQPEKVEITPPATTVERINQSVMFVDKKDKLNLLIHVLQHTDMKKVLVFVGMKHFANRVVEKLESNRISSAAIHGNKSQNARQNALEDFSRGRVRVLVATDIASRGIDVDGISHVINFDLPNAPEDYVHRIGRTARAGNDGSAVTFCTGDEKSLLVHIEKTTRQSIRIDDIHPYHSGAAADAQVMKPGRAKALIEGERRREGRSHRGAKRAKPGGSRSSGGGGSRSAPKSSGYTARGSSPAAAAASTSSRAGTGVSSGGTASAGGRASSGGGTNSNARASSASQRSTSAEGTPRSGGAPFRASSKEGGARSDRRGAGSTSRSRRPSRSR